MIEKEIIITDVSKMPGGICIYGYDQEYKGIRPILWSSDKNIRGFPPNYIAKIKPFMRVKFRLIEHRPTPPHTEDWLIDEEFPPEIMGELSAEMKKDFLERILSPSLKAGGWGTEIKFYLTQEKEKTPYIEPGEGLKSIITIKPKAIRFIRYSERSYRIKFYDMDSEYYNLSITDLGFRNFCDNLLMQGMDYETIGKSCCKKLKEREVFLRIGAGRPFTPRGQECKEMCFLFVTGIYSFPDYRVL